MAHSYLPLPPTPGRVTLLIASGLSMCVCHLVVALLASAPNSTAIGLCIVLLSCVFVMSFAYGWGPIAWTVCSEIYPM